MAKIRVNKIDAARRQIDAAIRMLFDNGDPVAIHTLAAAGGRILRDLCGAKGTPMHQMFKGVIRPDKEKEFWEAMNRPANFFKHADRDADEILDDVDERFNDFTLFYAVEYYRDLGYTPTAEMRAFMTFFTVTNPDILQPDCPPELRQLVNHEAMRRASRAETLATAKSILGLIRRRTL
jgi:hypothetical protein